MEQATGIARLRVDPMLLAALLLVPLLSTTDFCLTLLILEAGGQELNPIFRDLLSTQPLAAYWIKMVLTLGGTAVLAATAHLRPARVAIFSLLGVYGALVTYEIWLIHAVV